jgi:V8-like Glu-specific endopeptidase
MGRSSFKGDFNMSTTTRAVALALLLPALISFGCGGVEELDDLNENTRSAALNGTNKVNGAITSAFPFVARINFEQGNVCTGALITPRHVLTAGHCKPGSGYSQRASVYFGTNASPGTRYHSDSSPVRHPGYVEGGTDMYDLMILTLTSSVTGRDPVPLLPRRNANHLKRGSWVRHVSFGPSEAGAFGVAKSTWVTRTTEASISAGAPSVYTIGYGRHGDSGSPVVQRRRDGSGVYREVLVAVLSDEAIRSTWINDSAYSWIRGVVGADLSDDYDGDARPNIDDDCPLKSGEGSDSDGDGVGSTCDSDVYCDNPGQFDSNGDGNPNGCDSCPFPVSAAPLYNRVQLFESRYGYWTRNRARLELINPRSPAADWWFLEDFRTRVEIAGASNYILQGTTPRLPMLAEGRHSAVVKLLDGCGNLSAPRTINFGIDDTDPTVSITSPANNAAVNRLQKLTVQVVAGDLTSGISKVEIWYDHAPDDDEFTVERKLCTMGGPWMTGPFANTASCQFLVDFSPGFRKIVAVATDRAGNQKTYTRTIFVKFGGMVKMF